MDPSRGSGGTLRLGPNLAITIGRTNSMVSHRLNRISRTSLGVLSLIALLTVTSGYFQVPQPDEGWGAHIFQLSVVLFAAALLVFLASADWKQPIRSARDLVVPGSVLMLSFAALSYLEHYFYAAYYH
jgi:hypothetical protein